MHIFNFTNNKLEQYEFVRKDIAEFHDLGITYYENKYISVLLKSFSEFPTSDMFKHECLNIREILIDLDKNIWNSYYLICLEGEIEGLNKDLIYLLERDKVAIRKYVIQNKSDIYRIPFLSRFSVEKRREEKFKDENDSYAPIVEEALQLILNYNGYQKKLTEAELNSISEQLIKSGIKK
ncbi:ABC-three component system middle component 1 [Bacillus pacificus]